MNTKKLPAEFLIAIGAAILFIPFLGATHLFDWDEINFAEASREMLLTGNYAIPQINFQPFWEKPPLFFWFQVLSMKIFGVNEFAARFPNAVCGIVTLIVLYRLGKKQVNERFGWIWTLTYAASILPHLYFKSGIIDPWFNLFIFLSVYQLAVYSQPSSTYTTKRILFSALFSALAVMTKGPVALLIIGLCYGVFIMANRFKNFMKLQHILLYLLVVAAVGSIWFIALLINGQAHIIQEFIVYQIRLLQTEDAGHGGPLFYHFIILLIGCFPAAALSIVAMRLKNPVQETPSFMHRWMMILFWVVLILFSLVKTKIVHYSSLAYFPLSFLAAIIFYKYYRHRKTLPAWNKWLQAATGIILSLAIIAVGFIDRAKPWLLQPGKINDEFARANLQANVEWTGFEIIPGFILLAGTIIFITYAQKNIRKALLSLFFASLIMINLTIVMIAPKVEPYSQGAAIEFYKNMQGKNVIVEPLGFKSYAHLFYTLRPPHLGQPHTDSIIHHGAQPEVEVYFVGKIHHAEHNEQQVPNLERLYDKNGFVFYRLKR